MQYPVYIMTTIAISTTLLMAYILKIIEYAPKLDDSGTFLQQNHDFQYYTNSLWYIYITFLTIGYGDYYPKTMPGRWIGVFTAIYGTLLLSVLIILVQENYALNSTEANVKVKLI
jgi:hypothetical protein